MAPNARIASLSLRLIRMIRIAYAPYIQRDCVAVRIERNPVCDLRHGRVFVVLLRKRRRKREAPVIDAGGSRFRTASGLSTRRRAAKSCFRSGSEEAREGRGREHGCFHAAARWTEETDEHVNTHADGRCMNHAATDPVRCVGKRAGCAGMAGCPGRCRRKRGNS